MKRMLSCCIWVSLACGPAAAAPEEYVVRPGGSNEVVFESSAPMETFRGKTRALSGRIHADPKALGDSVAVHFEVDLASLGTGLPKRDKHMRENHLEVAKYPTAVFDGASVNGASRQLVAGRPVPLGVEGTFSLHGVRHRVKLIVNAMLVRARTGDVIEFATTFPVSLAEYEIPRPEFLMLKLADVQKVSVRGIATTAASVARR